MEREAFLGRIRAALPHGDGEGPPLPSTFPPTPASGREASAQRFLDALASAGGSGALVARYELADAVAEVARAAVPQDAEAPTAVVAPDADEFAAEIEIGLRVAGIEVARPPDADGWRAAAEGADLGVTSAELGVASTGSVLIAPGPGSPRVASLLPAAHLVVMPADRLVSGLEDALPALAASADESSAPVLVTGPSRTSDIEMITVLGVHGPRSLHVLLVGEW